MRFISRTDALLFQSTPLREGRHYRHGVTKLHDLFQSTPLREGRPHYTGYQCDRSSFNPRPCVRGDPPVKFYKP